MAIVRYYVSQQHGSDDNDGLSALTAWKSLTKAFQTVPTPGAGDVIMVHIGPGTYRERPVPTNDGLSAESKIYYMGDPDAIYNTADTAGNIRITGYDASDSIPSAGAVVNWTGKLYLELCNVFVDGSSDGYCCYNVPVCRRVRATGLYGFYNDGSFEDYFCTAFTSTLGFNNNSGSPKQYNCAAICAGNAFNNVVNTAIQYSCFGESGAAPFYKGVQHNCTAIGGAVGFSTSSVFNGLSIGTVKGFHNTSAGNIHNCLALACQTSFNSADYNTNAKYYLGSAVGEQSKHITIDDVVNLLPKPVFFFGLPIGGYIHNQSYSTAATMNLTSERFLAFTPPAGRSVAVQLHFAALGTVGDVLVELQKYTGGTWVTQRSKTINVANLIVGYNTFTWDTATDVGDNNLTASAGVWRYRITATEDAMNSTIYGSAATTPSTIGYYIPSGLCDIEGKEMYDRAALTAISHVIADYDYVVYQTAAPSIKLLSAGERLMKLAVSKGVETTVTYQVRHDGAMLGAEPQIRVSHAFLDEVVDTHSAGANTWEALSLTFTPAFDGEVNVYLANRDPSKNAWFSDPVVVS